jgi:hypothetical protein
MTAASRRQTAAAAGAPPGQRRHRHRQGCSRTSRRARPSHCRGRDVKRLCSRFVLMPMLQGR